MGKNNILLLDDEESIGLTLKILLINAGFNCCYAFKPFPSEELINKANICLGVNKTSDH